MGDRRGSRRNIAAMLLSWIVWNPFQSVSQAYIQLYAKELGASPLAVSAMSSAPTAVLAVSRLLGGYIADRYGRKNVLWKSTMLVAATYALYAAAPDWRVLFAACIVTNVLLFYQPAIWSLIADSTTRATRGKVYAVLNFTPGLVGAAAPAVMAYFVSRYGLVPSMRTAYALAVVAGFAAALIRWKLMEETIRPGRDVGFVASYAEALGFAWRKLRSLIAVEAMLMASQSLCLLASYYSVYYLGLSAAAWGTAWTARRLASLAASLPSGYGVDRVGRRPMVILAAVLQGLGALAFYAAPRGYGAAMAAVAASVVLGVSMASFMTAIPVLLADLTPPELRGRVTTVASLVTDTTFALCGILGGCAYQLLGARFPFLASAALAFLTIPISLVLISETKCGEKEP